MFTTFSTSWMSMHGLLHVSYELIKLHETVNVTDQNLVFTTCLICFIIFFPQTAGWNDAEAVLGVHSQPFVARCSVCSSIYRREVSDKVYLCKQHDTFMYTIYFMMQIYYHIMVYLHTSIVCRPTCVYAFKVHYQNLVKLCMYRVPLNGHRFQCRLKCIYSMHNCIWNVWEFVFKEITVVQQKLHCLNPLVA